MPAKISVIMATYNHERYVAHAIRSVLDQTYADFEFLIADDGSSDGTPGVVAGFNDPRMCFVARRDNRGSAATRNELIERAQEGQYIAVQNSDDCWALDKLAHQVEFLDGHPDVAAMFGRAALIDQDGAPLSEAMSPFVDQKNRTSAQWLRRFFEHCNCLCHSTVMLRRSCHAELGLYDPRYRQLNDFDMWVRLCKQARLFVSDRVLTFFRRHEGNLSKPTKETMTRHDNEVYLIARRFFDGLSKDLLIEGFGDLLRFKNPASDAHCDIEKALIYFNAKTPMQPIYRVAGMERLYDLMSSPLHRPILRDDYGIDHMAFQRLTAEASTFYEAHHVAPQTSIELQETKRIAQQATRAAAHANTEKDAALDALAETRASTSWRVTGPLRFVGSLLHRRRNG